MAKVLVTRPPLDSDYRNEGARAFFSYFDLGLAGATGGQFSASRVRANRQIGQGEGTGPHRHAAQFQFIHVLRGRALVDYEGQGPVELTAGMCVYQPMNIRHNVLEVSADYEHLQIDMPAQYATTPA